MPQFPALPAYQPDRPVSRRTLNFEPTGFYQQATGDYPVTLQLTSAGQVVVGWFALPPGVFARRANLLSWPMGTQGGSGALVIDARHTRQGGGHDMHWWTVERDANGVAWTEPTWLGETAPWETSPPMADRGVGVALFTGDGAVELRFHPSASSGDAFTRYAAHARVPTAVIATADGPARDLLIAHHACPIAPRWAERLVRRISSPEVVERLGKWQARPSAALPSTVAFLRKQVIDTVDCEELRSGALPSVHADLLRSQLQLLLAGVGLELNKQRKSLLDWFRLVAADEPDTAALAAMTNLGVTGLHESGWAYIVDMVPVTPDLSGTAAGAKLAPTAFLFGVRRLRIKFQMTRDGPRLDSDGNPVVLDQAALKAAEEERVAYSGPDQKPRLSERVDGEHAWLAGFLGELGVGLELDVRRLVKSLSVLRGASIGGADPANRATYFTSAELASKDFDGAWYSRVYLGGPGAGIPAAQAGVSSALHSLTLRNGLSLTRVETKSFKDAEVKGPSSRELASALRGAFDWFKDLFQPKIQLASLGISLGYVKMFGDEAQTTTPGARSAPPPRVVATAKSQVLFEVDSPRLIVSTADIARDGRAMLEATFATYRALLNSPTASLIATGMASPEGKEDHNARLSAARAETTIIALEAACPWSFAATTAIGLGEAPARKAGLADPPLDPVARAAFENANPWQVGQWPRWRRVELLVSGRTVLQGYELGP